MFPVLRIQLFTSASQPEGGRRQRVRTELGGLPLKPHLQKRLGGLQFAGPYVGLYRGSVVRISAFSDNTFRGQQLCHEPAFSVQQQNT